MASPRSVPVVARDQQQRPVAEVASCAACGRPIGHQPQVAVLVHLATGLHLCHPGDEHNPAVATPVEQQAGRDAA